jgi:hypothetical protein
MFNDKDICPEQKLWWHIKYILTHRDNLKNAEETLKWMSFDKNTRIKQRITPMSIEEID